MDRGLDRDSALHNDGGDDNLPLNPQCGQIQCLPDPFQVPCTEYVGYSRPLFIRLPWINLHGCFDYLSNKMCTFLLCEIQGRHAVVPSKVQV
jgi:hypothetical protein